MATHGKGFVLRNRRGISARGRRFRQQKPFDSCAGGKILMESLQDSKTGKPW